MKILNLYAGIGGNRKLWDQTGKHEITAVENNKETANIYHDYYPNDNIIIDDAHQFLLANYKEFDFIWSSPPCPTHSKIQWFNVFSNSKKAGHINRTAIYPDMNLYQEIILLKSFVVNDQKWVIENVIPYYEPLILGEKIGRHLFWSNFKIDYFEEKNKEKKIQNVTSSDNRFGYDLSIYKIKNKRQILRNCVNPEIGLYILQQAMNIESEDERTLFDNL